MKKTTCAGNMSQVVFVLCSVIDHKLLESNLRGFAKELPVLIGGLARDYNLAPYWRIPKSAKVNLDIKIHRLETPCGLDSLFPILERSANNPFNNKNEHIKFDLIQVERQNSYLAMAFDHRLLDARGAEAFLNLFQQYLLRNNDPKVLEGICLSSPSGLSDWMRKFYAGRNVNRKFIALSKTAPHFLPIPAGERMRGFRYEVITFNKRETEAIENNVCKEAGYLMEMPYLLAVVINAMQGLFNRRGVVASNFLIPVSVDMRTSEDIKQELFFNHVSYLFFQISAPDITSKDSLKGLIKAIKKQMFEQVKAGIAKDLAEASFLTRIAPLPVLGKLLHLPFKGKVASFVFSHLGKSSYLHPQFAGTEVDNIFHMPRVPVPPGLGFFFSYFNGQLNFIISYLEGLVEDEELAMLKTCIKERLIS